MHQHSLLLRGSLILHILLLPTSTWEYTFDSTSEWSPFCTENLFYKPYVRISEGRNGPILRDRGPGFLDLRGMENLYICTNGLVFLYFKIVKQHGGILDDAVMQHSSHYCGFFNGKLGPDTVEKQNTLLSILLIAHPQDYRKISLQMFIAPLYNDATKTLSNFTSLAVINSEGECIIEKGKEHARIRVRGNTVDDKTHVINPGEERPTTLCLLDGTTHMGQDPAKIPLEKDASPLEEVYQALVYDSELKFVGCYKYPLLDQQQQAIIERRVNELSNDSFYIDKTKSELNPQDGVGLKFWTPERLSTYGDPLGSPDETALVSDVTTKQAAYDAALADKPKDISKIKQAKSELETATAKLKLVPYFKKYKELFESTKKYGDETKADWTIVSDAVKVDTINHTIYNFTYTLGNYSAMRYDQRFDQYNKYLEELIELTEKQSREYSALLHEETLKISPKITKAEVSLARHNSFMTKAKRIMYRVQRAIMDFEISHKSVADLGDVDEIALDTVVSIKNEGSVDDACLALEREVDQCKFVKPTPKRASQLAMNKLGKGGSWPGATADEWRDTVLEFLDKIFSKSCPYLRGDFVKGINGIVKGYLIKEPDHSDWDIKSIAGSPFLNSTFQNFLKNYNVTKKEDLFPDLKPKEDIWDDILRINGGFCSAMFVLFVSNPFHILEECDKHISNENEPLKFQLANTDPIQYTFMDKQIPEHVEQADLEFSFNWAIEMNFRIFATVLGICKLKFDEKSLTKTFHDKYFEDFLDPIRQVWLSNRDNSILKLILGKYYATGKGELWTKVCMEASFVQSGHPNFRPLRKVFVNSFSELNYFADGPLQQTRGEYFT